MKVEVRKMILEKKATNPHMENMAYSYHNDYGSNGASELSKLSSDKTGDL